MSESYTRFTGLELLDSTTASASKSLAEALYLAPFALMSHNTDADPIFNFGNQTTLELFEMDWETFIRMPSRLSAEPVNRAERARLLEQVTRNGYIDNYSGVRISSTGKRFRIERATVWNVSDKNMNVISQASMFNQWKYL